MSVSNLCTALVVLSSLVLLQCTSEHVTNTSLRVRQWSIIPEFSEEDLVRTLDTTNVRAVIVLTTEFLQPHQAFGVSDERQTRAVLSYHPDVRGTNDLAPTFLNGVPVSWSSPQVPSTSHPDVSDQLSSVSIRFQRTADNVLGALDTTVVFEQPIRMTKPKRNDSISISRGGSILMEHVGTSFQHVIVRSIVPDDGSRAIVRERSTGLQRPTAMVTLDSAILAGLTPSIGSITAREFEVAYLRASDGARIAVVLNSQHLVGVQLIQ